MASWRASQDRGFFSKSDLGKYDPGGVGFSMSGGGYRATLFHAGAIVRLNELGVLPRIDRISSVSGGSITAGLLGRVWGQLVFSSQGVATNLRDVFLQPLREACSRTLDIRVAIAGLLPFVSAGNRLAELYEQHLFKGFRLRDLPDRPAFIFNSTNLQTGGLFRFTKNYLADWRALECLNHNVSLATAVAAS